MEAWNEAVNSLSDGDRDATRMYSSHCALYTYIDEGL